MDRSVRRSRGAGLRRLPRSQSMCTGQLLLQSSLLLLLQVQLLLMQLLLLLLPRGHLLGLLTTLRMIVLAVRDRTELSG